MYCNNCKKHVVFGQVDTRVYNEAAYIIGGVTMTRKCPKCKEDVTERKA